MINLPFVLLERKDVSRCFSPRHPKHVLVIVIISSFVLLLVKENTEHLEQRLLDKMLFGLSSLLFRSILSPYRAMSSAVAAQGPNNASNLEKNELYQIGPGFWNVRGRFKILAKLVDIETQMSIVQLRNGKFLVIDTVEMNDRLRQEIDQLTKNGEKIEAVVATHPFHTLAFPAFYQYYPKAAYYGTPRHLRRLTDIPWAGDLDDCNVRKKWEPDVYMRIPAGRWIEKRPFAMISFLYFRRGIRQSST